MGGESTIPEYPSAHDPDVTFGYMGSRTAVICRLRLHDGSHKRHVIEVMRRKECLMHSIILGVLFLSGILWAHASFREHLFKTKTILLVVVLLAMVGSVLAVTLLLNHIRNQNLWALFADYPNAINPHAAHVALRHLLSLGVTSSDVDIPAFLAQHDASSEPLPMPLAPPKEH